MPEETPKQLAIDGIIANDCVTYTQSTMMIEHQIKPFGYVGLIITAIIIFILSLAFGNTSCLFPGLIIAGIILSWPIAERSSRYEIDKNRGEIKCKWGGYLIIFVDKPSERTYLLKDVAHIRIHQISDYRGTISFSVKIVFQNEKELELPSGHSIGSCMEYANVYRDFLELQTPIKLPR